MNNQFVFDQVDDNGKLYIIFVHAIVEEEKPTINRKQNAPAISIY